MVTGQLLPGIALHIFALCPGTRRSSVAGLDSPEVLKESHKTGSMRASFYICVPGTHYKFKNAFFGKHFA